MLVPFSLCFLPLSLSKSMGSDEYNSLVQKTQKPDRKDKVQVEKAVFFTNKQINTAFQEENLKFCLLIFFFFFIPSNVFIIFDILHFHIYKHSRELNNI